MYGKPAAPGLAPRTIEEIWRLVGDSAGQGERDRGFRGLAWSPWASSYAPSYRVYGVFRVPSYPLEPPG
jgi:hypothetical protein